MKGRTSTAHDCLALRVLFSVLRSTVSAKGTAEREACHPTLLTCSDTNIQGELLKEAEGGAQGSVKRLQRDIVPGVARTFSHSFCHIRKHICLQDAVTSAETPTLFCNTYGLTKVVFAKFHFASIISFTVLLLESVGIQDLFFREFKLPRNYLSVLNFAV